MAELRRLFIEHSRLKKLDNESSLDLLPKEEHYLTRVLRLRNRDSVLITDGLGNLWEATIRMNNKITLNSSFHDPLEKKSLLKPLLCLAVVIPKKGFSDILRMSSEIGIDIFQPLISERSINKELGKYPTARWDSILNEAVEQSERLWKPELRNTMKFDSWVMSCPSNISFSIGATRQNNCDGFEFWLGNVPSQSNEVWIAIGPEGGWTNNELRLARKQSFPVVHFGDTIMRTSTAAISASQLMASWKRKVRLSNLN